MSEQRTRLSPSERLHALASLPQASLPRKTLGEISAEAACVRIASESYGRRGQSLDRDQMICLAREACDHNGWKYSGSR